MKQHSATTVRAFVIMSMVVLIVLQALTTASGTAQTRVPLQPFAQQTRQVETTLAYLGQPLAQSDLEAINAAIAEADEVSAVGHLTQILDKYTLAVVEINPESRVKVQPGTAKAELVEAGTHLFLVKVLNKAGVTAQLVAESPNALPIFVQSDLSPEPPKAIVAADSRDRWMGLELYDKNPMSPKLSGLPLEYRILAIYSRDQGQRSAAIGFKCGAGHARHRLSQRGVAIVLRGTRDGSVREVEFDVPVERSSWLAVRILGSSHTNPIFVLVDGRPIRASRESAQWCLAGVNQCWTQKAPKISKTELPEAKAANDHAREVYTKLIAECDQ